MLEPRAPGYHHLSSAALLASNILACECRDIRDGRLVSLEHEGIEVEYMYPRRRVYVCCLVGLTSVFAHIGSMGLISHPTRFWWGDF